MFKASQSKVKTWRRCTEAYSLKYVEHLRRKKIKRPFMFGRIVHEMAEANANGDNPFKLLDKISFANEKLFAAEREMYGEIVEDVRTIMKAYFEYWPEEDLTLLRRKGKSAEHKFEIEILPGILWNGIVDAIGRTPNKLRWMVERKSFKKKPSDDHRWRNLQSITYIKAIKILGWAGTIDGTCWDYIRSIPPTRPQLLKNGSLSQKHIKTLPATVRDTIKGHGLKLKDYPDLMGVAEEGQSDYFSRIFTPVNPEVVDHVFEDFLDTVKEMAELHGKKRNRAIEQHCDWCDYEPICRAILTGGDVDFVKEKEYYIDDKEKVESLEEDHEEE